MNFNKTDITLHPNIRIRNFLIRNGKEDINMEIVRGLTSANKYISSKFFYNETGSKLFEEITSLEEYYPTRTEKSIFEKYADEIMDGVVNRDIIELGSGDCSKISMLMDSIPADKIESINYLPVDVSRSAIQSASLLLQKRYPDLKINGYVLDFTRNIVELPKERPALLCFFGSTIGNFDPLEARNLLRSISEIMVDSDTLLVGFDMVKPENILQEAYNDSRGVTASFNRNILDVVNSIIESDFNSDLFKHNAYFNSSRSRIEMHLIAKEEIIVRSKYFQNDIVISKGESIHTENSYKFSPEMISELAGKSGLKISRTYSDKSDWFSLVAMERA